MPANIRISAAQIAAAVTIFLSAGSASAQTYGFATLPPGTLNHTTASAISKIMKEKGGVNMLVQPTAGDQVINPLVGRGEVEIGITNLMAGLRTCASSPPPMRCARRCSCGRTPGCSRTPTSRASA